MSVGYCLNEATPVSTEEHRQRVERAIAALKADMDVEDEAAPRHSGRERERVIQYADPGRAQMIAVAIKKSSREKAAGFQEMGTLRCDLCGEEFFIGHNPAWVDKWVAEKQAKWLEKVLAEEHERDKKHPDRIELPD